jgi:2-amino-4-hydroxy-6-hydroxymethyldihydropteridine diphosphokinase
MSSTRIFLSLGSNLGDRLGFLRRSLEELGTAGVQTVRCSSIYETEPLLIREQPKFLNQVCEVVTLLPPEDLLRACLTIEEALGRRRTIPKGPREIDIDILFYQDRIIEKSELMIPHPGLYSRRFVLVPLAEIAPDFVDPRTGMKVRELLQASGDLSEVQLYQEGKAG